MTSLRRSISDSPFSVEILQNVKNVPELMAWADISISAAGAQVGNWLLWACQA